MKVNKELRGLSEGELKNRLEESKKELLKLQAQASSGTGASNPGKMKQTKKNVARMLTIIEEKEVKER